MTSKDDVIAIDPEQFLFHSIRTAKSQRHKAQKGIKYLYILSKLTVCLAVISVVSSLWWIFPRPE